VAVDARGQSQTRCVLFSTGVRVHQVGDCRLICRQKCACRTCIGAARPPATGSWSGSDSSSTRRRPSPGERSPRESWPAPARTYCTVARHVSHGSICIYSRPARYLTSRTPPAAAWSARALLLGSLMLISTWLHYSFTIGQQCSRLLLIL
jgi:hypothetical protein